MAETRIQLQVWHDGVPQVASDCTTASIEEAFHFAHATLDRVGVLLESKIDRADDLVATTERLDEAEQRLRRVRGNIDRWQDIVYGNRRKDGTREKPDPDAKRRPDDLASILDSISMDVNGQEVRSDA